MASKPRTYSFGEWARAYAALVVTSPIFLILWFLARVVRQLPQSLVWKLLQAHVRYTHSHPMDFRIPPDTSIPAYMNRWWRIPRNPYMNVYLHQVMRSDDDRALHCHPWWSFSLVLEGGYHEHTIAEGGVHHRRWFAPGTMQFRWWGGKAHRLELRRETADESEQGNITYRERPALTVFITGPVMRRWGFHDGPRGWVDAYDWDEHCEKHGLKQTMRMDGGSDAAISERNKHHG